MSDPQPNPASHLTQPPIAGPGTALSYPAHLGDVAKNGRKGARTKAAICVATCHYLDGHSANTLTVSGICKQTGIAHGTFYLHFADRNALLAELLLGFVDFVQIAMRTSTSTSTSTPTATGTGDKVRASTEVYYDLFAANRGLMKCLVNRFEDFPEALAAFQKMNHDWVMTVVTAARRRNPSGPLPEDERIRRAYAMGGMVDQYLTAVLLNNDPTLSPLSQSRAQVIDTLTTLWKKGLEE